MMPLRKKIVVRMRIIQKKMVVNQKKKKKTKKVLSGRKNIFDTDEDKVDWKKELEEERKEINEEKEEQKADDLFAAFKKDTSTKPVVTKKVSSISSLFDPVKSKPESKVQEPQKPSSRLASLFDDVPKQKETSDSSSDTKSKPKSLLSGLFDDEPKKDSKCETSKDTNSDKITVTKSDKSEITKVFDFAGEAVTVTKEVSADSTEAKKFLKSQENSDENKSTDAAIGVKRSGLA